MGPALAAVLFTTVLALVGIATPALAGGDHSHASSSHDDSGDSKKASDDSKDSKKSKKKASDKKSKDSKKSKASDKKSKDSKKSKSSSKKSKSSKKKAADDGGDKDDAEAVLLIDIAVAEYTEWIDEGLATKKDNDVVSIRHAISCGDRLIRDLLKQGKKAAELDEDERDDADFVWNYEEVCDPAPKKKSSGNGTAKKKKKTVSTADKLRQAEKARIQIEEWIADGVFEEGDPAIEAVLYTLDCADAMIEYTLSAGRIAIEDDTVGVREVIHAHEDICESQR